MNALTYMILLVIIGMWNVTDGIFSICSYPQERMRQHWVRFARSMMGIVLIYLAYYFGTRMF